MEKWKPVECFEDYEISDQGRIKRISPGCGTHPGRVLSPITVKGYLKVTLRANNNGYLKFVHVLVAKAFLPNPLNLPEVNHKGKKTDNRATMLEWRSKEGHRIDVIQREQRGRGITFSKEYNKWYANYYPEAGRRVHLGSFATEEDALKSRKIAVDSLPYVV